MTDTPESDPRAELIETVAQLKSDAGLQSVIDEVDRIFANNKTIDALRKTLAEKNPTLNEMIAGPLTAVKALVDDTSSKAVDLIGAYRSSFVEQVGALDNALKGADTPSEVSILEEATSTLRQEISDASDAVDALIDPYREQLDHFVRALNLAVSGAEAWAEFSGERESADERVYVGAAAEWVAGKGKDEAPDGILYLTNSRLIFEQKEKVGKTLGLFGGKKVQEVEWTLSLGKIKAVRAEDKGMLGGRDMLYITYEGGEYTLEIKGSSSNDDWVKYLELARAGRFFLSSNSTLNAPSAPEYALLLTKIDQNKTERLEALRKITRSGWGLAGRM